MSATDARRAALFAGRDDATLISALLILGAAEDPTAEQRLVTAWTCAELRRRHPEVDPILDAWIDSADCEGDDAPTYAEALIAALPTAAAA